VGEKIVRDCHMLEGTKISLSDVKDEIFLQGNDIEKVSQSAASITDKTRVKDKDVSQSGSLYANGLTDLLHSADPYVLGRCLVRIQIGK